MLVCVAGCTEAQGDLPSEELGQASGSFAYLGLTQRASQDNEEAATQDASLNLEINAVFVRYYDTTRDAVQALLDVPAPPAQEGCQFQEAHTLTEEYPDAQIELLNAGPLMLQLGSEVRRVYPRTFPELGSLNTGAIYASEEHVNGGTEALGQYLVFTQGSQDVAEFSLEVALQAVAPVGGISDRGQAPEGWAVNRSEDLAFSWDSQAPNEVLYIDILSGEDRLRCIAKQPGDALIPSALLKQLQVGQDAEIRVFRERRNSITLDGLDSTEVVHRLEAPAHPIVIF